MRGRWFGAVVVTALLVLVTACARPVGTLLRPSQAPSPSPAVQHAPLTITDAQFHGGEVGVTYTPVTLAVTGGVAPYSWNIAFGGLPNGLALGADGTVSGSPTAPGTFSFGIQVFDSVRDTAGVPHAIAIASRLTASIVPACATECTVELGCVAVCGNFGRLSGGVSPLTYARTSGALPNGTTLSGLTLQGTFTGLPGRLQFSVQVTDGLGVTTLLSPTFNMLPHIALSGGVCSGTLGTCAVQLLYSGGTPGQLPTLGVSQFSPNCSTYCPPPPKQFSAIVSGGAVNVTAAQVTPPSNGTYKLILTDQNLCASGTYCTSQPATLVVNVYVS